MTYTFKYTEKNLGKGSEFETRALIFLMSLSQHRDDVHYLFIDCFNDVSGTGYHCNEIFDVQSKGVKKLSPKKIGESLVTLFINSISSLKFSSSILFLETVDPKYLLDKEVTTFGSRNFGENFSKISIGLKEEFLRRTDDFTGKDIDTLINGFLDSVTFVLNSKTKEEYIKSLTKFKNDGIKDTSFFEAVFKEIQDIQISKKTILIESQQVKDIREALGFKKHLIVKDIHTLVINRIVGVDLFKDLKVPLHFLDQTRELSIEENRDLIQNCYSQISKAIFDKSSKKRFWDFLELGIIEVTNSPSASPLEIYNKIDHEHGVHSKYLKGSSGIFLISLIKEGFE